MIVSIKREGGKGGNVNYREGGKNCEHGGVRGRGRNGIQDNKWD